MLATIQPFFTLSKCLRVTTFLVPGVCLFVGRRGGRREEEGGGERRRKEEGGGGGGGRREEESEGVEHGTTTVLDEW